MKIFTIFSWGRRRVGRRRRARERRVDSLWWKVINVVNALHNSTQVHLQHCSAGWKGKIIDLKFFLSLSVVCAHCSLQFFTCLHESCFNFCTISLRFLSLTPQSCVAYLNYTCIRPRFLVSFHISFLFIFIDQIKYPTSRRTHTLLLLCVGWKSREKSALFLWVRNVIECNFRESSEREHSMSHSENCVCLCINFLLLKSEMVCKSQDWMDFFHFVVGRAENLTFLTVNFLWNSHEIENILCVASLNLLLLSFFFLLNIRLWVVVARGIKQNISIWVKRISF